VTPSGQVAVAKRELRTRLLTERRRLDPTTRSQAAERLAEKVTALIAGNAVGCVCAYVSLDEEPGTVPLLARCYDSGITVLLPMLRPGGDLDWARYRPGDLHRGPFGLLQPASPPLGTDAVRAAELIICPGLAGTPAGDRLGRGGGSYDRALARSRPTSRRCLLLYDSEVLDAVPTDAHDERVDVIVTPTRNLPTSVRRLQDEGVGG
jgi:5-formyltetrahydrofolate cyclo-ligase